MRSHSYFLIWGCSFHLICSSLWSQQAQQVQQPTALEVLLRKLSTSTDIGPDRSQLVERLDQHFASTDRKLVTIVPFLTHRDQHVRGAALGYLEKAPELPPALVDAITQSLPAQQNDGIRRYLIHLLSTRVPRDGATTRFLMHVIEKDPDDSLRALAAGLFREGRCRITEAAKSLLERCLSDQSGDLCVQAAYALRDSYPAPALVFKILKATQGRSAEVRASLAQAIVEIGIPAIRTLRHHLRNSEPNVRSTVAVALGELAVRNKPLPQELTALVPDLRNLLTDPISEVRSASTRSLGLFGVTTPETVTALIQRMSDSSSSVRRNAMDAITRLFPLPKEAIPHLVTALGDSSRVVRAEAARSLDLYGADAAPAYGALLRLLERDSDLYVRCCAATAIGRLGPTGRKAIPTFQRLLRGQIEKELRTSIEDALHELTSAPCSPAAP